MKKKNWITIATLALIISIGLSSCFYSKPGTGGFYKQQKHHRHYGGYYYR
jgi:hypothetical protein